MNTIDKLRKVVKGIEVSELKQIDKEIKTFVASIEENSYIQTTEFIYKKLVQNCKNEKKLQKKCRILAKVYLIDKNEWMKKENIFCFSILIYLSLTYLIMVVQELIKSSLYVYYIVQVAMLIIAIIVSFFGGINDNIYKNKKLMFLLKEFHKNNIIIIICITSVLYASTIVLYKINNYEMNKVIKGIYIFIFICEMASFIMMRYTHRKVKQIILVKNKKRLLTGIQKISNILKNKFSKKRIGVFVKKSLSSIYKVISVISTLTIFTGMLYFAVGKITNNNQSDNDLIMKQIKEEIGQNQQIINIEVEDIHGFGNNSIIVTAANTGIDIEDDDNRLIILERVDNEILNRMNDALGLKSNYRMTFSNEILTEGMTLIPEIDYVVDVLGDSAKEILVNYYVYGSTYSAYYPAIYKYSYETEKYEVVGTYPVTVKYNLSRYSVEGEIIGTHIEAVYTKFNDLSCEENGIARFNDYEKSFNLTQYSYFCRDYWAEFSGWGTVMVVVDRDKWTEEALINVYETAYDELDKKLEWRVVYSEYTTDLSEDYSKDELAKWMENKFNCRVKMY